MPKKFEVLARNTKNGELSELRIKNTETQEEKTVSLRNVIYSIANNDDQFFVNGKEIVLTLGFDQRGKKAKELQKLPFIS